jgi:hypothetical protein
MVAVVCVLQLRCLARSQFSRRRLVAVALASRWVQLELKWWCCEAESACTPRFLKWKNGVPASGIVGQAARTDEMERNRTGTELELELGRRTVAEDRKERKNT